MPKVIKNNFQFFYRGNLIDTRYCSHKVVDLICEQLEKEQNLEVGSVDYQLLTEE